MDPEYPSDRLRVMLRESRVPILITTRTLAEALRDHQAETAVPAAADAENLYYEGSLFADCGKKQAALRLLQGAIDQNYCSYTNLQLDPMLRKVRQAPGFEKLLTSAEECQRAVKSPENETPGP